MTQGLTSIKISPTGMRLHEWICLEERYFEPEGLEPEVRWDVVHGMVRGWRGGEEGYKQRPQDTPFLQREATITNACMWGSVCNAGAGMGKFVPDAYGIARHAGRDSLVWILPRGSAFNGPLASKPQDSLPPLTLPAPSPHRRSYKAFNTA